MIPGLECYSSYGSSDSRTNLSQELTNLSEKLAQDTCGSHFAVNTDRKISRWNTKSPSAAAYHWQEFALN